MSHPSNPQGPPNYVLISTNNSSSDAQGRPGVSSLSHPVIVHYQYADDPPLNLIPQPGQPHVVLVMDYDDREPHNAENPVVQSLSDDVIVTEVRISDAPGAPSDGRNSHMYVIEKAEKLDVRRPAVADAQGADESFIQRFKQRNDFLRKAVKYGAKVPPVVSGQAIGRLSPRVPEFPSLF